MEASSKPPAATSRIADVARPVSQRQQRPISSLPAITFLQPDPAASSANRVCNRLESVLRRASAGRYRGSWRGG